MISAYELLSSRQGTFEKSLADYYRTALFTTPVYYQYFKDMTISQYNKICKKAGKDLVRYLLKCEPTTELTDNCMFIFGSPKLKMFYFNITCASTVYVKDLKEAIKNNDFKDVITYGTEPMYREVFSKLFIPTYCCEKNYEEPLMDLILTEAWFFHDSIFKDIMYNHIKLKPTSKEAYDAEVTDVKYNAKKLIDHFEEKSQRKWASMSDKEREIYDKENERISFAEVMKLIAKDLG